MRLIVILRRTLKKKMKEQDTPGTTGKTSFGMSKCCEKTKQRQTGNVGRVLDKFGKSFG